MSAIGYDKYEEAWFDDGKTKVLHTYPYNIVESVEELIIKTHVVIDNIRRGWVGDITLNISGIDISRYDFWNVEENKHVERIVYKDVLCAHIIHIQDDDDELIQLEYHFLKY